MPSRRASTREANCVDGSIVWDSATKMRANETCCSGGFEEIGTRGMFDDASRRIARVDVRAIGVLAHIHRHRCDGAHVLVVCRRVAVVVYDGGRRRRCNDRRS